MFVTCTLNTARFTIYYELFLRLLGVQSDVIYVITRILKKKITRIVIECSRPFKMFFLFMFSIFLVSLSQTEKNIHECQVRGNVTMKDNVVINLLECDSPKGKGEVTWYKDKKPLKLSDKFLTKDNKLLLFTVLTDLEGYSCYINMSIIMNCTETPEQPADHPGEQGGARKIVKWERWSRAVYPLMGIIGQIILLALIIMFCDNKKGLHEENFEESIGEDSPPSFPVLENEPLDPEVQEPELKEVLTAAQSRWKMISDNVHHSQQHSRPLPNGFNLELHL